jgi:streptogramin lyase
MIRTWCRKLLARCFPPSDWSVRRPRRTRRRPPSFRPRAEALEDRCLLSLAVHEFPLPTASASPGGIVAAPDGNLWFTERAADKIGEFNPVTHAFTEISLAPGDPPYDLTVGPDGNVWFTQGAHIGKIDLATHAVAEATIPTDTLAEAITSGPDGNLWFVEAGAARIGELNPATLAFQDAAIPSGNKATGITSGPDGCIWFTESEADQVGQVLQGLRAVNEFHLTTVSAVPQGIVSAPDGNLWFTANGEIAAINPTTHAVSVFADPTPGAGPAEITVGPDGNVWFSEYAGDQIGTLNLSTHAVHETSVPTAKSMPDAICLGPDGNLWFVETGGNAIGEVVLASSVSAVAGNNQTAVVGAAFGTQLDVQVRDVFGNPVAGATVTFAETDGSGGAGASFNGAATGTTNAQGEALAPPLVANHTAGDFTVTAAVGALSTTFDLTNRSGPSSSLEVIAGPASVSAGQAFTVQIDVMDGYGNRVADDASAVTVKIAEPTGSATPVSETVQAMDGIATFTNLSLTSAGFYLVSATDGRLSCLADAPLTVISGSPALLTPRPGATGQSAEVGTAYANPLAVLITDAYGNPASGAEVTFTAPATMTGPSGTFAGGASFTIPAGGVATAPAFTADDCAGTFQVTVTAGALSTELSLTNLAGSPAAVVPLAGTPQSVPVMSRFGPLAVQVTDRFGNPVSGASVTFAVVPGGNGAAGIFAGAATVLTNLNGVAIAPLLSAGSVAGSFTVTAAVDGIAGPATFALTNTPGAPDRVAASGGATQDTPVGWQYGSLLQATVVDAYGNPVPAVPVTFSVPVTGPSGTFAALATVPTDALGMATAPVLTANHVVGSFIVLAKASDAPPAPFLLTNTNVPASVVAVAGAKQKVQVTTPYAPLRVRVLDAHSQPVRGTTVVFELPGDGPGGTFAGPATVVTDANGMAQAPSLTANRTAGTFTVGAWVAGVASPATISLTNNPGTPASVIAVGGTPQRGPVGKAFQSLKAQVVDAFQNPVPGVTVTFTAPVSGPGGTFAGKRSVKVTTGADGIAAAPALTANSQAGDFTVTATVAGLGTPASFRLTSEDGPTVRRTPRDDDAGTFTVIGEKVVS